MLYVKHPVLSSSGATGSLRPARFNQNFYNRQEHPPKTGILAVDNYIGLWVPSFLGDNREVG